MKRSSNKTGGKIALANKSAKWGTNDPKLRVIQSIKKISKDHIANSKDEGK